VLSVVLSSSVPSWLHSFNVSFQFVFSLGFVSEIHDYYYYYYYYYYYCYYFFYYYYHYC